MKHNAYIEYEVLFLIGDVWLGYITQNFVLMIITTLTADLSLNLCGPVENFASIYA